MTAGFDRQQYLWVMDHQHRRSGYGDLSWSSQGTRHTGTFEVSEDPIQPDLVVEFLVNLNESRDDEPTFVLKLNGVHAARVDVNGWHKFQGEKAARRVTHFQSREYGSSADESTHEIPAGSYPTLATGVNVNFEDELQYCFRASVAWLNVDVSGVTWTPMPFKGGL